MIRELGKVFGLPKAEIDLLVDNRKHPDTPDHITKLIYNYASRIHDFPSHLSIHAGGILISEKPIYYYTATNMPPKNFPLTQFSMLEAEDVGLYKFDILSQRGLGKIKDAVDIIKQNRKIDIDIHDIKSFKEDPAIRKNLKEANLMGCFYVESPGMRMLLTKLKAQTYLDLVAASSIIRPGVSASGMMREYILRFHDAKCLLNTQEHARQIDIHHVAPLIEWQVFQRNTWRIHASVVEQDIDPAIGGDGRIKQRPYRVWVGHVGRHNEDVILQAAFPCDRVQRVLASAGQHDPVTGLKQRQRCGFADPAAGTGHDGDSGYWRHGIHTPLL